MTTRTNPTRPLAALGVGLAISLLGVSAATSSAQPSARAAQSNAHRETLTRLSKPLTIDFEQQRLEDVIRFVADYTGAQLDPLYLDDVNAAGLDPDMDVTFKANDVAALSVLERVLDRAAEDAGEPGSFTWQLDEEGMLQLGPKERLNARKRTVLYDINDLIIEIPDYDDAPEFDLQSVLQSSQGGGGGGQSPFSGQTQDREVTELAARAAAITDMLRIMVEPDEWVENGGDAASVRFFQGHLIVRAPDYVHRQINGYPFWPRNLTRATYTEGRRNVNILPDPKARRQGP